MKNASRGTLSALRDINRKEVLEAIRANPMISRTALTGKVQLSRATVSGIIAELIQAGLLEEIGEGDSTGGRPPITLQYRPENRMAVGVVLFNDAVQAVLTDMEGKLLRSLDIPVPHSTPDSMLQCMQRAVENVLTGVNRKRVLGVGVGTPGIVNLQTGIIELSTSKRWLNGDIQVKDILEAQLGLPVHVTNRSRVAALGEFKIGLGRGLSSLIYLFLGQGIVAGIVLDGQLFFGSSFGSGEIGHISIYPDGPLCACGNHGCLEVYATEEALLARAREAARESRDNRLQIAVEGSLERLTLDHVLQAAQEGDSSALSVLRDAGTGVGIAVATLINLFNPEMVVIGGPLGCRAGEFMLQSVIGEAKRRALPRLFVKARIVSGTSCTYAEAIGAAVLAVSQTPVDAFFATG
jgi:predicted NBD/HSP70 family sugar kinase